MVPCCLRCLLSSPVEAVIRYCQPSGRSYRIQVERSQAIAFPYAVGWERTGELPETADGAESLCHTNEQSVNKCALQGTWKKEKKHLKKIKRVDYMAEILV